MAKKETEEIRFMKSDLLRSKRFIDKTDLVSAVLDDDRSYSFIEAENEIKDYLEGKVN